MLQILDDKISLTILAQSLDIPTIPWNGDDFKHDLHDYDSIAVNVFEVPANMYSMATVPSIAEAVSCSDYLGFPVTIKTSQHSGGCGVESVQDADEVFIDHTLKIVTTLGYFRGLGTVEFLFNPETLKYYFLKLTTPTECEYSFLSSHLESDCEHFNLSGVLFELTQGSSLSVIKSIQTRYSEDLRQNEEVTDFFKVVNTASRVLSVNANTVSLLARLVDLTESEEVEEQSLGVDWEYDETGTSPETDVVIEGDFSLTADYQRPDSRSVDDCSLSHDHDASCEPSPSAALRDLRLMGEFMKDGEEDHRNDIIIDTPVQFYVVSAGDRSSAVTQMMTRLDAISVNLALASMHNQPQYRQSIGSDGNSDEDTHSNSGQESAIEGLMNILVSADFADNKPTDLHTNWLQEKFLADLDHVNQYVDSNIGGLKVNTVAVADDSFFDHSSNSSGASDGNESGEESVAESKMSDMSTGSGNKYNHWSSAAADEEESAYHTHLETAVIIENYVDSRPSLPPTALKGVSAAATAVLKSPEFFYEMIHDRQFGQYGFQNVSESTGEHGKYNYVNTGTGSGKKRGGGGKNSGKHDHRSGYVLIDVDLTKKLSELTKRQKPSAHVGTLKLSSNHIKYLDFPYDANDCMKIYFSEELVLQLDLQYLAELDLSSNVMTRFPGATVFAHMPILNKLVLCGNKLTEISSEALVQIATNGSLVYLDLSNNSIESVPVEIGLITTLSTLRLDNNCLTDLPMEITRLSLLLDTYNAATSFNVSKNELVNPPQNCAAKGGMRFIRTYFQLQHNIDQNLYYGKSAQIVHIDPAEVNYYDLIRNQMKGRDGPAGKKKSSKHHSHDKTFQLKLLILGQEGCGKTSLAQRLQESAKHEIAFDSTSSDMSFANMQRDVSGTPGGATSRNRSMSHSSNTTTALGLHRDVSGASLSTTSSGGNSGKYKGVLKPLELPRLTTSSSFNFTETTMDDEEESPFTHEVDTNAALSIRKFHPKKKHLNAFLNQSMSGTIESTTPGSGNKLSKRVIRESNVFEPKDDVKYLIHDFCGQHSPLLHLQEMLFSAHAIHLVAFDITRITTHLSVDHYIQYWIDLVQSRVPDAFIMLVATHCDLLEVAEADAKIAICDKRLQVNMETRAANAALDRLHSANVESAFIKHQGGSEKAQFAARDKGSVPIPDVSQVDFSIMRVACPQSLLEMDDVSSSALIKGLSCRIVQLSTATKDCPHPLGIIGKAVTAETNRIKLIIADLRNRM
eukprot:gene22587-28722_t